MPSLLLHSGDPFRHTHTHTHTMVHMALHQCFSVPVLSHTTLHGPPIWNTIQHHCQLLLGYVKYNWMTGLKTLFSAHNTNISSAGHKRGKSPCASLPGRGHNSSFAERRSQVQRGSGAGDGKTLGSNLRQSDLALREARVSLTFSGSTETTRYTL